MEGDEQGEPVLEAVLRQRQRRLFGAPRGAGHDFLAALALIAVAIPEQIATARLAGVPPATGLLVFATASFGFCLLGANRYLSVGADSTIAPVFAAGLALLALEGSGHYLALAALLAVMVGATVALAGLLRLGWVARLLSIPVITGFLAGISVHIAISQAPALLGIAPTHGDLFAEIAGIVRGIGAINLFPLLIGTGTLAIVIACERIDVRLPGALIAAVLASLAVSLFGLEAKGVATLGTVARPSLWPPVLAPNLADLEALFPVAAIVSLIVVIQTVTVCKSFDSASDDINRDLIGVGLANIMSGSLGGFPANASPPRTAIARESGAASRAAGLIAALGVALFLALGLPLLSSVPQASLAGLLLFVAARIFRLDVMKLVLAQSRAEFVLLAVTALAIVTLPIETGVATGIGLSVLHGVWTITQSRAILFEQVPGSTVWWPKNPESPGKTRSGVVVVGFQAPLFFLNAETFRRSVSEAVETAPGPVYAVILEASSIVEIDFSGAQILANLIRGWKSKGVSFYLARLESVRAQAALKRFGLLDLMGSHTIFHSVDDALRHLSPPEDGA
ncbi:MAG TPA: SulP family inorganic anion transporter [Rhizomicrobium sp.]|jgi:SulP family sulfate permease|nr:SulP family inorganic anion transporter [Rhizomicrobium sp.]